MCTFLNIGKQTITSLFEDTIIANLDPLAERYFLFNELVRLAILF